MSEASQLGDDAVPLRLGRFEIKIGVMPNHTDLEGGGGGSIRFLSQVDEETLGRICILWKTDNQHSSRKQEMDGPVAIEGGKCGHDL